MKTLKIRCRRNLLMSIHVIFMVASVTLLSSCYATIHTPRSARGEVIISSENRGEHRNSNDRYERRRLRQERHHNQNDN